MYLIQVIHYNYNYKESAAIFRIVEIDLPYSAQIGFWNPELIISSGLLKSLDLNHLKAVQYLF